jgi:two-component system, response regulator PdtaR
MPTRVLLAEDEPLIRMDLREELEFQGYLVVGEAGGGLTAVTLARELRPDLVIMCIVMPQMDGITAAHILHTERIAPVMLLTALSDEEMIARAAAAEVVMYLVKPWRQSELRPAIETALARHAERSALEQRARELEEQLATRRVVERASGVLMRRERLSVGESFRRIQRLAMNLRASMREVAEAIVETYGETSSETDDRLPTLSELVEMSSLRDPVLLARIAAHVMARLGERAPAEQRAEKLLLTVLSEAEQRQLAEYGYVEVPSTLSPDRIYRIPRSGRLPIVYEHGAPVYRLCIGPVEPLPSADLVLSHLLLIRADERRYLANRESRRALSAPLRLHRTSCDSCAVDLRPWVRTN